MRKSIGKSPGAFFFAGNRATDPEEGRTMEELKIDNTELNKNLLLEADKKDPDQLPEENQEQKAIIPEELPRLPNGKIDVEKIATGTDDKGNYIIPDEILDKYYRDLPKGCVNTSYTWRTNGTGGKLKILTSDDTEIQRAGGKVLQATLKQQRTFAEAISTLLAQKASRENIEELRLNDKADNLDVVIASMLKQASRGNVKAADFLRDTIGQKPTEKLDAAISGLTPEDKELLQNVSSRLGQ